MKWASWVNVLLGLWLVASPWVLGYGYGPAVVHDVVLGITIGAVALWSATVPSTQIAPAWINVALGLWLIVAPWMLGLASTVAYASTNDPLIGILTMIFAGIRIATARPVPVA
jgi:hypothetical protein